MRIAMTLCIMTLLGCGGRSALPVGDGGPWTPDGPRPVLPGDGPRPDRTVVPDAPRPDTRWVDPQRPPLPAGARCRDGWCLIQAGTFHMGSPPWETCRNWGFTVETRHQVTLTRDYEIAATEVTQGQFSALMGYNPSAFSGCGDHCPVERARWHHAAAYCNALSQKNGLAPCYSCSGSGEAVTCQSKHDGSAIYTCPGFRLPTEAEWEHAYRAGTKSAYFNGDNSSCTGPDAKADAIAWYDMNAGQSIHPVAGKSPNAWGLFDMAGNAIEWTHDNCHQDLGTASAVDPAPGQSQHGMVLKGGAWLSFARQLRGAYRTCGLAHTRSYLTGFRCARTLPD